MRAGRAARTAAARSSPGPEPPAPALQATPTADRAPQAPNRDRDRARDRDLQRAPESGYPRRMKRIVKTLITGAVGIVGVSALMARRVTVKRTSHIAASSDEIYALVASFQTGWIHWSPFGTQRDPSVVFTYEGPPSGTGATQRWTSQKMRNGRMSITAAEPNAFVRYELEFLGEAFRGEGSFELAAHGDGCDVTWSSTIDLGNNPLKRWLGPFIRRGMGGAFDEGLTALARAATRPHSDR